jgi:SAM-dependent methyltransferase
MPTNKPKISSNWFHNTFDSLYPILYAHRTIEAAEAETLFSIEQTQLHSNDRVLDLCCGGGRHMAHLINTSDHVTGLDYSQHLLTLARETLGTKIPLIRGDMRHLPFNQKFDVVMNYFTSFGYFRNQSENQQVVHQMANSLKPNGRFFIDYMCKEWAINNIEAETHRTIDGFDVSERRWIETDGSRINKATIIKYDGEEIKHTGESVQLYTQTEFTQMLVTGGLTITDIFGNYTKAKLSASHPRMIVVGRKA